MCHSPSLELCEGGPLQPGIQWHYNFRRPSAWLGSACSHVWQSDLWSCPRCCDTRHLVTLYDLCQHPPSAVMSQPALQVENISSDSCSSKSVCLDLDTNWQKKQLCYQCITYKKCIACILSVIVSILTGYINIIYLHSKSFLRSSRTKCI